MSGAPRTEGGASSLKVLIPALSLTLAWYFHWKPRDLVWGLWISSLLTGLAQIYGMTLGEVLRLTFRLGAPETVATPSPFLKMPPPLRWVFATFLAGFFTVHFGGFHFGHAAFLSIFFPLHEGASDPFRFLEAPTSGLPFVWDLFVRFWPLVGLSFVRTWRTRVRAEEAFNPFAPYRSVVRFHLLIFAFAGLHGGAQLGLDARVIDFASISLVVLFFSSLSDRWDPFSRKRSSPSSTSV